MHSRLHQYFFAPFTVDNAIFGFDEGNLKVLLIRRSKPPFLRTWALPGYFVKEEESLDEAAKRVLWETTGLENVYLRQLKAFGEADRHPDGRVVTTAYYSLVKIADYSPTPAGLALEARWFDLNDLPSPLAFDHKIILEFAFEQLRRSIRQRPVGFQLLPREFTLSDLQHLYEAIWGVKLEKRNFRKKILSMNLLVDLDRMQEGVPHRPARLYRFDEGRYRELTRRGFNFEIKERKKRMVASAEEV